MVARKLEKYLTRQFEEHVSRDSIEREQKYRIARVDTIRKRLLKLGAQVHASGFERNELYDCDDRLRRQDLKLRLRCHGGKIAMLTLKGPRQNEHQKTRMEVETPDGLSRLKAHEEKSVKRRAVSACDRPIANIAPIVNSSKKPRR